MIEKNLLLNKVLDSLNEIQAIDITTLNVSDITTVTDFMVICQGRSSRHVKAIADNIIEDLKKDGFAVLSANGLKNSEWILVDFGDVVVHIMLPETRSFYNLEGLWQES